MKWTLVTGGCKRLGAAICLHLAEKGYPVLVHYRKSEQEAQNIVSSCRNFGVDAEMIQGDFSTIESTSTFINDCLKHYPDIKVLINNVGNYLIKPPSKTTSEEWNGLFQSNVNAPFAITQAFISALIECQGSVINMGVSGVNSIHADVKRTAYMATKMSLLMLTKSLAKELASKHVRVNMISPGYLENAVDLADATLPMQRPASFDEIMRVISFLLDSNNSYITGQNIEVAGGIGLEGILR